MKPNKLGDEFRRYAVGHHGISSMRLHQYTQAVSAYITPNIIEERPMNVAVMDVFSRLMMDRIVFLGVPINNDVSNILQAQLLFLESSDPTQEIQMYINSPVGSVYAALGLYDTMQYVGPDVVTICTSLAASMAAILLAAGTAGKRYGLPHARVMIHQPLGGVQGQAADIEITAREILKLRDELYGILADHTGQPVEKIAEDADRDYWMRSDEAKEYGIIDEVRVPKKRKSGE